MTYKNVTIPTKQTLIKMSYQELLALLISVDEANTYNMVQYDAAHRALEEGVEQLAFALGADHPIFEKILRLSDDIPLPPKITTPQNLMHSIRKALGESTTRTERECLLAELKVLGYKLDKTHKSVKELKRILERHHFNRIIKPLVGPGRHWIHFDRTACKKTCPGWNGVSVTCECGRSVLKWKLNPNHTIDTPQLQPVRIGVRDSV